MDNAAPEPLEDWATGRTGDCLFLHASAVALGDKGILISGASGSGKSSLALTLMSSGCHLISDDGVWIDASRSEITLVRPDTAPPMIEARGVGLLNAGPICERAQLVLAVDLNRAEPDRLPPRRRVTMGAASAELILGARQPMLAPAILHLIRHGRATV